MPSSEIFQNPGVAHFVAAIPDRHWAPAAPPAASQNRVIPLIWLQISPCAYAPRTRGLWRPLESMQTCGVHYDVALYGVLKAAFRPRYSGFRPANGDEATAA